MRLRLSSYTDPLLRLTHEGDSRIG
jgi:hypothetical protein